MPEPTYKTQGDNITAGETPLEAAARLEAEQTPSVPRIGVRSAKRTRSWPTLIPMSPRPIPASLPEAEQALNAWEIPSDPLEGVPGGIALEPGVEGEPFVSVFTAQSESEANIVRGVVEAAGIPVTFDGLPTPIMGSVFQAAESRWGDLLVPASLADPARAAIAEATASSETTSDNP